MLQHIPDPPKDQNPNIHKINRRDCIGVNWEQFHQEHIAKQVNRYELIKKAPLTESPIIVPWHDKWYNNITYQFVSPVERP